MANPDWQDVEISDNEEEMNENNNPIQDVDEEEDDEADAQPILNNQEDDEDDHSYEDDAVQAVPVQAQIQAPQFEITTDGVIYDKYSKLQRAQKDSLRQCSFCVKFYKPDIVVKSLVFGGADPVCYHCIYGLNYATNLRTNVDGLDGLTIVDFILKCSEEHDIEACTRKPECFLCDHITGTTITGIKDDYKLKGVVATEGSDSEDVFDIVV
jgi:hypothetical protein